MIFPHTEVVTNQTLQTDAGPNVSDAYAFNGLPGPTYSFTKFTTVQKGE
jgi:hypothetical protein